MADRERQREIARHQEWLGFVQPVGLVVAPPVLYEAQVILDRNVAGLQRDFKEALQEEGDGVSARWRTTDLRRLFIDFLGWEEEDLVDAGDHREALEIALPELDVVLSPTWAVPHPAAAADGNSAPSPTPADGAAQTSGTDEASRWMMLIRVEAPGEDLDAPPADGDGWRANRQARFERLLRETGVPIGLLCTDDRMRLVYAPPGESSGHLTFRFSDMALPAGRPILGAFDLLLSAGRLFGGVTEARLPALLRQSREAQAEVSTRLSRQVLSALYELLRGFVAADARTTERRFAALAEQRADHVYGGLITALMRMVFVLYAEDRGLMPNHPVYQQHYALTGLFARLRAEAATWPDTMDQRFGAWAQLLSLFRLTHGGGAHGGLSFVARKGQLFDPNRYPFLEGRSAEGGDAGDGGEIPLVPDATVWQVLQNLMVLEGERLSYRTLDVEQIGSVYEAIMGFRIERTTGRSIAVRSQKRTKVAVVVDVDALLDVAGAGRAKALREATDQKLTGKAAAALREAGTPADVVAALDGKIDRAATPNLVPPHTPILQPTDERRRSGSHYTPRTLTEPIVAEALRPIFESGSASSSTSSLSPKKILDLRVLDPAMGSGAFLVEACRQVAERLVESWRVHRATPSLPADDDELLHARRLVARQCLYGVDKNPMAVDLARLSLWLVTLSKHHEFTFLDHALRHGNFLVGLTRDQIAAGHWDPGGTGNMVVQLALDEAGRAEADRARIREAGESAGEDDLRPVLARVNRYVSDACLIGDAVIAAFFAGDTKKKREQARAGVIARLGADGNDGGTDDGATGSSDDWRLRLAKQVRALRTDGKPVVPFHFEIEFPEVFDRDNPGFDAIVGNPPFSGKDNIAASNRAGFLGWLKTMHDGAHGNADLVAHFFRRAFLLLRRDGAMGLIATNTIRQGDTRSTGLRWIRQHGGDIYAARRRIKWPGEAAVVVSSVHVAKGDAPVTRKLDGVAVDRLTAYLVPFGGDDDSAALASNVRKSFIGSYVLGMGFTFDDDDTNEIASTLDDMRRLIDSNPSNKERIFPYIGGDEVNSHPTQAHDRYAIDFEDFPLKRADIGATWTDASQVQRRAWLAEGIVPLDYRDQVAADWPELLQIVKGRVKPERDTQKIKSRRKRWWQYASRSVTLYGAVQALPRVLAVSRVGEKMAFTFLPIGFVYAESLVVFSLPEFSNFAILQSRVHELWARFFGSSLKDDLRYTPTDCFETFPFPDNPDAETSLEEIGERYYGFRADVMSKNNEGLTTTYNRFHDQEEAGEAVIQLRRLHDDMDRAVLAAYGWSDLETECVFDLEWKDDDGGGSSRRSKPWRYRWPQELREEVLGRLWDLNAERAQKEALAGGAVRQAVRGRKQRRPAADGPLAAAWEKGHS